MTPNFGRTRPNRIHARKVERFRRTLCGRDLPRSNSIHQADQPRLRLVSCRSCLAKLKLNNDRNLHSPAT